MHCWVMMCSSCRHVLISTWTGHALPASCQKAMSPVVGALPASGARVGDEGLHDWQAGQSFRHTHKAEALHKFGGRFLGVDRVNVTTQHLKCSCS